MLPFKRFPYEHGGVAVEDGGEAEEGVEDADAGEVFGGTEVRYALFGRGVIDFNGKGYNGDVAPGGAYQQFQFCLITGGDELHGSHFLQWIKSESRLRVRKF